MVEVTGRLAELVRRLDALSDPTLIKLANTLEQANLSVADVAAFVKETPRSYHRATVVKRESYELLIFTWVSGQGSAPHDHAGSVSAMQVLQGEAAEGCWRIASDGYVDQEFETPLGVGGLTAWQDAGVHTVRNSSASGETLVTVHVYSPPLRDFLRYIPRPSTVNPAHAAANSSPTIVVVGGGFSGTMTAAQILRTLGTTSVPVRVVVVERQGTVGEGLAYSTRDQAHLLNVPAGRMSAWPDRPDDFLEWANRRYGVFQPGDFLPRRWYGEYVRESLLSTAKGTGQLEVKFDEVRRLARRPSGGWVVNFARGSSLSAHAVVLAIGHRPPPDPIGKFWSGPRNRFIADPWQAFATQAIGPDDPVVILGCGLTSVDAVLSLAVPSRTAPITLISRRGLVPQSHAAVAIPPVDLQPLVTELLAAPGGVKVKMLFGRLRRIAKDLVAAGQNWRGVVDGLRRHTASLWQTIPCAERRRFLSRLRPYWEVHRHRMALGVAEKFNQLLDQGMVRIVCGSVASAQADESQVRIYVRERGDDRLREFHAGYVINCTGPTAPNSAESNPAIGSLLVHGWAQPDELSLGLETTAEGNVVDFRGAAWPDLFIVGTLRKPALWESTAVPELRQQAADVARRAVEVVSGSSMGEL